MEVSITVHVDNVSFTFKLKYSLNNQNPLSLICESIRLPEPIDKTISSGLTPVDLTNGKTIPAVVNPATVADPTENRIKVAISQPIINGDIEVICNKFPI